MCRDFHQSWIARYPRRTGEAYLAQYLDARFVDDNFAPPTSDLDALQGGMPNLRQGRPGFPDGFWPEMSIQRWSRNDKIVLIATNGARLRATMAKKGNRSGKGRKAKSTVAPNEARRELVRDGGGCDWGWPRLEMVASNPELSIRLAKGGFNGCGYGLVPNGGPPFISLMGDNEAGMKSAMALLRNWTEPFGPNAIRLEIAFDGPGYVLAISQQYDMLRWRLAGMDTARVPIVVTISHIKRLTSRHPMLGQLARYLRRPVAPVWLLSGTLPSSIANSPGSQEMSLAPDWDSAIWLPGIDIYTDRTQRPFNSMIRYEDEEGVDPPSDPLVHDTAPPALARDRDQQLWATLPKTMHTLRLAGRIDPIANQPALGGCGRWQIEQAICNLRLHDFVSYEPKSQARKFELLQSARQLVVEPASHILELSGYTATAVADQVALDAGYLLRRLEPDIEPPATLADRNQRLRTLGYG